LKKIFACITILLLSDHRFGEFLIKHLFKEKKYVQMLFSYPIHLKALLIIGRIPARLCKIGIFIPIDGEISFSKPVVTQFWSFKLEIIYKQFLPDITNFVWR